MQWEPIIAAATTGLLALLGVIWQSRKTRTVNSQEHQDSQKKLDNIANKVDRINDKVETVSDRLDDHIVLHRMTEKKHWWRK
jgi:peptidoglycan hydrolase CwlO-like protein